MEWLQNEDGDEDGEDEYEEFHVEYTNHSVHIETDGIPPESYTLTVFGHEDSEEVESLELNEGNPDYDLFRQLFERSRAIALGIDEELDELLAEIG